MVKAIVIRQTGGPEVLRLEDVEIGAPGPGEVRIRQTAIGVNFIDTYHRSGLYPLPLPSGLGMEGAGVVEAVGEGVKGVFKGDRVIAVPGWGGLVERLAVPASSLIPMPEGMSFEEAAALTMTYGTSYYALKDRANLQSGETLLVLGAAGGVGTAAIQIAKAAGAKVIAAASTDEKCALCKELGADATINYSTQNLRDELKTLTEGKGPDVIYDPVGGDLTEQAFRSIGWRGRLLVVGFANGAIPSLPLNLTLLKGASVMGVFWGEFARREPQNNAACLMQLAAWYMEGKIKPVIEHKLPMSQLKEAFALMGSRQVRGKVVLVNG